MNTFSLAQVLLFIVFVKSETFRETNNCGGIGGVAFTESYLSDSYRLYSIGINAAPYQTYPGLTFNAFESCYRQIDPQTGNFMGSSICNTRQGICSACALDTFIFHDFEHIRAASGCSNADGSFVGRFSITTNERSYSWGNGTTSCVSLTVNPGNNEDAVGFAGRAGNIVDQLRLIMRNSSCYNGVRISPTNCSCSGGYKGYQCNLQITSGAITTRGITTSRLTTSPITSSPITTSPLTTSPVTTSPVTTSPVTTSEVTSAPITTSPITSSPVTTSSVTTSPPITSSPVTTAIVATTSETASETSIVGDSSYKIVLAITIPLTVILMLSAIIIVALLRFKKKEKKVMGEIPLESKPERFSHASLGGFFIKYSDLTLMEVLGAGAFGVVYKGIFRETEVAIKKVISSSNSREDILAEAEIMQKIPPHPNVLLFRGVTLPPDPVCIVTDFCPGGSLLSYLLANKGQVPESKMISLAKDIAVGMLHLHTSVPGIEVVHRDLAARNILIKKDGTAAISDFGLARAKNSSSEQAKTSNPVGPLKWYVFVDTQANRMEGWRLVTIGLYTKSDSFSYGVVLYEITTQEEPWLGINGVAAITKVVAGDRMEVPIDCPTILKSLMEICWEHAPEARPDFQTIIRVLTSGMTEYTERNEVILPYAEAPATSYVPLGVLNKNNI